MLLREVYFRFRFTGGWHRASCKGYWFYAVYPEFLSTVSVLAQGLEGGITNMEDSVKESLQRLSLDVTTLLEDAEVALQVCSFIIINKYLVS
jgi:hypothetical protein